MPSRFPAAFRPPAFASWAILFPLGSYAFLTVSRPGGCTTRTPTGFPRSTRARYDRGGCSLYPEAAVSIQMAETSTTRRLPLRSGQPCTPLPRPIGGAWDHETSSGVHSRSPVRSSPDLWLPDGTKTLGSHHLSSAPHRYRRRTSGWGRVHGH